MLDGLSGDKNIIVQLLGDSQPAKRQEPDFSLSGVHLPADNKFFGFALEWTATQHHGTATDASTTKLYSNPKVLWVSSVFGTKTFNKSAASGEPGSCIIIHYTRYS